MIFPPVFCPCAHRSLRLCEGSTAGISLARSRPRGCFLSLRQKRSVTHPMCLITFGLHIWNYYHELVIQQPALEYSAPQQLSFIFHVKIFRNFAVNLEKKLFWGALLVSNWLEINGAFLMRFSHHIWSKLQTRRSAGADNIRLSFSCNDHVYWFITDGFNSMSAKKVSRICVVFNTTISFESLMCVNDESIWRSRWLDECFLSIRRN